VATFDEATEAVRKTMAEAYQRGWCDAMTVLRKQALETRYLCPAIDAETFWLERPQLNRKI